MELDIHKLERGDEVYCIKMYIDTEIPQSLQKYAEPLNRLIHLTPGNKYKVGGISEDRNEIGVYNDFGVSFWYDVSHFGTIKDVRRIKLKKLI